MPVMPKVSYPGVYVQEVESDVHTIAAVDTSTTAFVGRALRGPVNKPTVINNFGDFERIFGGLWRESSLGYAVQQFFSNDGSKAVIVRVYRPNSKAQLRLFSEAPTNDQLKSPDMVKGELRLRAKKPGPWGNCLTVLVTYADADKPAESATKYKVNDTDLFNLTVSHPDSGAKEEYTDLTIVKGARRIDKILEASQLIELDNGWDSSATTRPMANQKDKPTVVPEIFAIGPNEGKYGFNPTKAITFTKVLPLIAKNPGTWGSRLKAETTDPDPKIADQLAVKYGLKKEELFNLKVTDEGTGRMEYFADLTILPNGQRRVDKVLENESDLVAYDGTLESGAPTASNSTSKPPEASDGGELDAADVIGSQATKTGIYALEGADIFNLLVIPPYKKGQSVETSVLSEAATYCQKRRALLLIDPPDSWTDKDKAKENFPIPGLSSDNAAVYFPNVLMPNRLSDNQIEAFGPGGVVAGVIARTDATRGVWKAPAGTNATLKGVVGLKVPLTDAENGELNPLGINCLRQMPAAGYVVWGARTIQGDDRLASQWKYIPVRRTALFIEESLYRGTQWAVFEPNDEPLWSQLRLNIGVFMHDLFRQGAFQGAVASGGLLRQM